MIIDILSHPFTVHKENPNEWDASAMGRSFVKTQTIRIDDTMPKEAQDSTLIHETFHILVDMLGLELSENQVCALATGWYSFMRSNPELIREMVS